MRSGIVGLKPTYGRVSRFGVFPLAWSLDHVGPMTRSVTDAVLMLRAIARHDSRDPSSSRAPVRDNTHALNTPIRDLKVGILTGYFGGPVDPEVRWACETAVATLQALGAPVEEVELKTAAYTAAVYDTIGSSEALATHERWFRTKTRCRPANLLRGHGRRGRVAADPDRRISPAGRRE